MNQQECVWFNSKPDGRIDVGFQQKYINEKLQEVFHVLPANQSKIEKNTPILVLESNDGLEKIVSPFAGRFVSFSDKARNFPDRLKESDVVLTLFEEQAFLEDQRKKKPEVKKEVAKKTKVNMVADYYMQDDFGAIEEVFEPPPPPRVQPFNRVAIPPMAAGNQFGEVINNWMWDGVRWIELNNQQLNMLRPR